ncbi:hypothetical protein ACQB6R_01955 [Propionibacteriaceae bacterium G1746]
MKLSSLRSPLTRLALAAAIGLALIAPLTPTTAHAAPPRTITPVTLPIADHGVIPLTATTVAGAATGHMPDGSPRTWAVVTGNPAYLAQINPLTAEVIKTYPMPGASGAWGVELAADGTVWAASYVNGNLYYLAPGADQVVNAGRPHPYTSFLWQVDTDDNGIAYTGTFQGYTPGSSVAPARLGAYNRATGQWRDYGTFGDQYTYLRSTAVVGNTVYVGTGTTAAFFAVDITTGAKTQIPLPAGRDNCQFTYELATSGTDLWVRFECTKVNIGYVYDTVAKVWKQGPFEPNYVDQRVGRDGAGNTWFISDTSLYKSTPAGQVTRMAPAVGSKGIGVINDGGTEYVIGMYLNVLDRYNIATGESTQVNLNLPGTPTDPRSSVLGPDGRLHFGGYLSGGLASYDTGAGTWQFQAALGQTEGFATVGNTLYAGRYPGAKVLAIDPTKPLGSGNPTEVFNLTAENQDRPFALADAGGLVAVGTVPGYGSLQGALAIHNPKTGATDKYLNLIADHSITALAYRKGVLYGGTSVYGGNGITPVHANARVFAFDMATRTLLWNVEVEGQGQVTSLAVTPGNQLWAGTKGTLHSLDTRTGAESVMYEIAPFDWSKFPGGTWTATSLAYDKDVNRLYGIVGGKIISLQPTGDHQLKVLNGASGSKLVLGNDHRAYWVSGQRLNSVDWRQLL